MKFSKMRNNSSLNQFKKIRRELKICWLIKFHKIINLIGKIQFIKRLKL